MRIAAGEISGMDEDVYLTDEDVMKLARLAVEIAVALECDVMDTPKRMRALLDEVRKIGAASNSIDKRSHAERAAGMVKGKS